VKKNTFLTIIICLSLCFSIICSANAATSLTAKQLFLDAIKSTDLSIPEEQKYSMSSGNLNCKIKSFDSILAYEIESLEGIQGSELNIDYKLNTQQRKMEAAYNLLFNQDNYKGYIYLNNNNLILTSDIISQISKVYPDFALTGAEDLPKYIYFNDESLDHMWEGNIFSGQNLPPELKDLMVFIVEAIPEKCFSASLINQKITLDMNEDDFADFAASIFQKAVNEPDKLANLISGLVSGIDPTQDTEALKTKILKDLQTAKQGGLLTSEEVKSMMSEIFRVEELKLEVPLVPYGDSLFHMVTYFGGSSNEIGKVVIDINTEGSKEDITQNCELNLSIKDKSEDLDANIKITGLSKQTATSTSSNNIISATVRDYSGDITLFDTIIELNSDLKYDPNVVINVPVLTDSNSINIEDLTPDAGSSLRVFVNNNPVEFDIEPFVENGRTMIPIRNVAEVLGCNVNWVDPDQIDITEGKTSIKMYINKKSYVINGVEKQLDVPPSIKDGERIVVPLRFITEGLGCEVYYNQLINVVYITKI